jgi:hypothetical protein
MGHERRQSGKNCGFVMLAPVEFAGLLAHFQLSCFHRYQTNRTTGYALPFVAQCSRRARAAHGFVGFSSSMRGKTLLPFLESLLGERIPSSQDLENSEGLIRYIRVSVD